MKSTKRELPQLESKNVSKLTEKEPPQQEYVHIIKQEGSYIKNINSFFKGSIIKMYQAVLKPSRLIPILSQLRNGQLCE